MKPNKSAFAPYFHYYTDLVKSDNLLSSLKDSFQEAKTFLKTIPQDLEDHQYAPGKWTIKEVIVHIIDCERIFNYRALRIARGDKTNLPGFSHDDYVPMANVQQRTLSSLIEEWKSVRNSTIKLFESFDKSALDRTGFANDNPFTVRSFGYINIGHQLHHLKMLKDKYLSKN